MDRRAFMKFFGAGATVVPIIGGIPHSDAAAVLVEPPKVEPFQPEVKTATLAEMNGMLNDRLWATIDITQTKPHPAHFRFEGGSFVIWGDRATIDVTAMNSMASTPSGHWNTDFLPYFQRPADCEFDIHVAYKITRDRKPFKTGSFG